MSTNNKVNYIKNLENADDVLHDLLDYLGLFNVQIYLKTGLNVLPPLPNIAAITFLSQYSGYDNDLNSLYEEFHSALTDFSPERSEFLHFSDGYLNLSRYNIYELAERISLLNIGLCNFIDVNISNLFSIKSDPYSKKTLAEDMLKLIKGFVKKYDKSDSNSKMSSNMYFEIIYAKSIIKELSAYANDEIRIYPHIV